MSSGGNLYHRIPEDNHENMGIFSYIINAKFVFLRLISFEKAGGKDIFSEISSIAGFHNDCFHTLCIRGGSADRGMVCITGKTAVKSTGLDFWSGLDCSLPFDWNFGMACMGREKGGKGHCFYHLLRPACSQCLMDCFLFRPSSTTGCICRPGVVVDLHTLKHNCLLEDSSACRISSSALSCMGFLCGIFKLCVVVIK